MPFFALLYGLTWLFDRLRDGSGDRVLTPELVFVALVPFLALLVLTGRLDRVRGPGGTGVTLDDGATSEAVPEGDGSVEAASQSAVPVEEFPAAASADGGPDGGGGDRGPAALSVRLGAEYDAATLREAVTTTPTLQHVVFTDEDGTFRGATSAAAFVALPDPAERVASGSVVDAPFATTRSVSVGTTNEVALRRMDESGVDALALVDEQRRFAGMLTREKVVADVFLAGRDDD